LYDSDPSLRNVDEPRFQAVMAHVRRRFGRIRNVFHCSDMPALVHIDVLHVPPTRRRPVHTLVTCGMSQRPMCPPEAAADCRYAELYLRLPAHWPLESGSETWFWPVPELSHLALLPHIAETWLWTFHTVQCAEGRITPGLDLAGWVIGDHIGVPHEDSDLRHRGDTIRFWAAIPVYQSELDFARGGNARTLVDRICRAGGTETIDLGRPNLCPAAPG
jgi:hypothetical protein